MPASAACIGIFPLPTPPASCWAPAPPSRRRPCGNWPRRACWSAFAAAVERLCSAPMKSIDRKSTRLNSSHLVNSYAVFCLKKKNNNNYADVIEESLQDLNHVDYTVDFIV